jgi:tetratricopeptide (TPR) repeat protein
MSESFEYIEDYFEDRMDGAERHLFEARCVNDEAFAKDVAFYVCQRKAVRDELLRQKRAEWAEGVDGDGMQAHPAPIGRLSARMMTVSARVMTRRWILYGAAASVVLVVVLFFTLSPSSPRQLAGDFIDKRYGQLSQTMNGSANGLQQGIAAYNEGRYEDALQLFRLFYTNNPQNTDALKYEGIVYLRTKNYDNALREFEALARIKGLLSNPGLFLQAVTLLRRDAPGDRKTARTLLQEVVSRGLDGSTEAAAWLQKM